MPQLLRRVGQIGVHERDDLAGARGEALLHRGALTAVLTADEDEIGSGSDGGVGCTVTRPVVDDDYFERAAPWRTDRVSQGSHSLRDRSACVQRRDDDTDSRARLDL